MSTQRDERRLQALRAARTLLEAEGADGVSMRKLAKASGMAVNTLYAMFSTKDGILEAVIDAAIQERLAHIAGARGTHQGAVERTRAVVQASTEHALAHPATAKPMYRAASNNRALRRRAAAAGTSALQGLLEEGLRAGELRTDQCPGALAQMLLLSVHEHSLAWALDELDDEGLRIRCQYAVDLILSAACAGSAAEAAREHLAESSRMWAAHAG